MTWWLFFCGRFQNSMLAASSPKSSPGDRRSPRLAAKQEAARKCARNLADAVRDRVWVEARTNDEQPVSYFYALMTGETAWTLPEGAILRVAGRDSLCPRPGDRIRHSGSLGRTSGSLGRQSGTHTRPSSRLSVRSESLTSSSIAEEDAVPSNERFEDALAAELDATQEADAESSTLDNVELTDLLQVVLGWVVETKELYEAAKSELETLRSSQEADLKKAQWALDELVRRQVAAAAAATATAAEAAVLDSCEAVTGVDVDFSSWAAEVDRLRDALAKEEAQHAAERDAHAAERDAHAAERNAHADTRKALAATQAAMGEGARRERKEGELGAGAGR